MPEANSFNASGPLTRAVAHLLTSVGLISRAWAVGEAVVGVNDLLQEARRNLLPARFLWKPTPGSIRLLALRQYVLVTAIPVAVIAADFAATFGLLCIALHLLQSMALNLPGGTGRMVVTIALSGFAVFARVSMICVALAALSQPFRTAEANDER